jgi:serine protease AprX
MTLRRLGPLIAACVLAAGVPTAGAAGTAKLDPGLAHHDGLRALVMFDGDVSTRALDRLADAGVTHARVFDAIDTVAVLAPRRSSYRLIAGWDDVVAVDDDSRIRYANYVSKTDTRVTGVLEGAAPLQSAYTGAGVTVAVADSGVEGTHPDLLDRLAANVDMEHQPLLDDLTDGAYSESAAERPVSTDEFGHGTHVAGIVAGTGAAGRGADLSGVAPDATLVSCKMGFQGATETTALACFQWFLDHRDDPRFPGGIRIVTNSWSADAAASAGLPLQTMVRAMTRAGMTLVFAAGNDGAAVPGRSTVKRYPNSMEEVITVGATCKSREFMTFNCSGPLALATFSSMGAEVDVVAPGSDIWSTRAVASVLGTRNVLVQAQGNPVPGDTPQDETVNRGFYITLGGTSMSTPHVAGVAALLLEANPELGPRRIESILTRSARDLGPRGFDPGFGHGLVDALRATRAAEKSR